ncbi:hypothetical protein [Oryzomonas rubra]|uniref:Uncharacterized protein n=1 Tax=Oryzomonas rubra TaxID=2509454 RepID=A0A5A9X5P4_9BACT|nr:hypothetical protein [Oryzomonas rubra]KAA0888104.1 hypothetical protein ET418_17030 [Oryzomonas rubra]
MEKKLIEKRRAIVSDFSNNVTAIYDIIMDGCEAHGDSEYRLMSEIAAIVHGAIDCTDDAIWASAGDLFDVVDVTVSQRIQSEPEREKILRMLADVLRSAGNDVISSRQPMAA